MGKLRRNTTNLNKFDSFFKKGEQVFIGFRQGNSHGYISKVDKLGIYLIQLNHSKEYFYTWNQCEIICHAGYLVKQVGENEIVNLIMINLERYEPNIINLAPIPKSKTGNSFKLLSKFKEEKFNFKITVKKAKKIMEGEFPQLWNLYNSTLFDKANKMKKIKPEKRNITKDSNEFLLVLRDPDSFNLSMLNRMKFKSRPDGKKDELVISGNYATGIIELSYGGIVTILNNNKFDRSILIQSFIFDGGLGGYGEHIKIKKPKLEESHLWKPLQINEDSLDKIEQVTVDNLQNFTNKFSYVYSGDPYELNGSFISSNILESEQGFCFLNKHSELYATV